MARKKNPDSRERQIRYFYESENLEAPTSWGSEVHHWTVLLVNERREIRLIEQGLREHLQPTEDWKVITEGRVLETSLDYRLLSFDSYRKSPSEVPWDKIYGGPVTKDRKLADTRKTTDGLANYVDTQMTR
jgi:hypothetical protein